MRPTAHLGDCVEVLAAMEPETFDSVVCDPPYHLTAGKKGGSGEASVNPSSPAGRSMVTTGFMGKQWDGGDVAFRPETWAAIARVMKPGAYLVAFGGTRTSHRMACAIEDAGFEIRDSLMWLYASGFPKSLNVSKAIDKAAGAEREVLSEGRAVKRMIPGADQDKTGSWVKDNGREFVPTETAPATEAAHQWQGWGTALKPAHEPIILARKPLAEKTVAANVLAHGVGALNVDGCRVASGARPLREHTGRSGNVYGSGLEGSRAVGETTTGRWPPNILHDGSPEVLEAFARFGVSKSTQGKPRGAASGLGWGMTATGAEYEDSGTAARFFPELGFHYSGKATKADRVSRIYEEVTIEWISEQGSHRAVLQVDTERSHPRVIDASGFGDAKSWNTFLFGNGSEGQSLTGCMSTIRTATSSTTESKILNWWMRSLTSESTAEPSNEMTDGTSPAENAAPSIMKAIITSDQTEFRLGAESAALKMPLSISVVEKRSGHPTCKPQALMRWLCRLVTPPGGHVLDPFAGSGSTLQAAHREGFRATGIELTPEYFEDIQRRLRLLEAFDDGLFAGMGECA